MTAELVSWGGDAMPDGVVIERGPAVIPARFTERAARRHTDELRGNLERVARGIVVAWQRRAHEALGYGEGPAGWQAYVETEFGDVRLLALPRDERIELERSMTDEGWSRRDVAKGVGVSVAAVSNDLIGRPETRRPEPAPVAEPVVTPEPPTGLSKRDRAWQLVAEQGDRGLTALELADVTGWTGGSATGTMSDLKRQGRVAALAVFRRGYAAHVITEPATP